MDRILFGRARLNRDVLEAQIKKSIAEYKECENGTRKSSWQKLMDASKKVQTDADSSPPIRVRLFHPIPPGAEVIVADGITYRDEELSGLE